MRSSKRVALAFALLAPGAAAAQLAIPTSADEPARRRVVYFELGGAGGLYSLNLDRRIDPRNIVRFGLTAWDVTNLDRERHRVQAAIAGVARLFDVSRLAGREGRWVEIGASAVAGGFLHQRYDRTEGEGAFVMLVPNAGLRLQRSAGRWMSRLTVTAFVPVAGGNDVYFGRPAPSLGAGFAFGYVF